MTKTLSRLNTSWISDDRVTLRVLGHILLPSNMGYKTKTKKKSGTYHFSMKLNQQNMQNKFLKSSMSQAKQNNGSDLKLWKSNITILKLFVMTQLKHIEGNISSAHVRKQLVFISFPEAYSLLPMRDKKNMALEKSNTGSQNSGYCTTCAWMFCLKSSIWLVAIWQIWS